MADWAMIAPVPDRNRTQTFVSVASVSGEQSKSKLTYIQLRCGGMISYPRRAELLPRPLVHTPGSKQTLISWMKVFKLLKPW